MSNSNMKENQYVFLGYAYGKFKTEDGNTVNYSNIFAFAPVASSTNADYHASGFKSEKLKTTSPEVAAGLAPGMVFEPIFDRYGRVLRVESSGAMFKIG